MKSKIYRVENDFLTYAEGKIQIHHHFDCDGEKIIIKDREKESRK